MYVDENIRICLPHKKNKPLVAEASAIACGDAKSPWLSMWKESQYSMFLLFNKYIIL
jgi:hypothetical protein